MERALIHWFPRMISSLLVVGLLASGPLLSAQPARAADQVIVVTSAVDEDVDGCDDTECTLREAIALANATPGPATIRFAIPGQGLHTISPSSELPWITDALTIDGFSQSGAKKAQAETPASLMVELRGSGESGPGSGLVVVGFPTTISGLAVNSFAEAGVEIYTSFVKDEVIEVAVQGNVIGPDPTGKHVRGDSQNYGVWVKALGDERAPSTLTIGGTAAADRNVISANAIGVFFFFIPTASGQHRVIGNYIGTTSAGNAPLANQVGVGIASTHGITVGGSTPDERNVIAGNTAVGIAIDDAHATRVRGNAIGIGADGRTPVGNGTGVAIAWRDGHGENTIGGRNVGTGNIIAFNEADGVVIEAASGAAGPPSVGNSIFGNSIYANGELGIDLGDDGATANDTKDRDEGANNLQNVPTLTSVRIIQSRTTIEGRLKSAPGETYLLQFFANPPDDRAEGRTFLGEERVTTDSDGTIGFTARVDRVPGGDFVTATATNMTTGDTSEFSEPKRVS